MMISQKLKIKINNIIYMTTEIETIFNDGINNIIFNYNYSEPPYLKELKRWFAIKNELSELMGYQQSIRNFIDILKNGNYIYDHMCPCGMMYLIVTIINLQRSFTKHRFNCVACNRENEINITVEIVVPCLNEHILSIF